ncbi:MAG TPA: fumarylacetoacetate hydrolase family protein [Actinomycetota bacterium]|jgi:2-keto-4-pentenoate hydratase/2-oxohepta-3-ene-1,7-dioic acid hydratase in catechol pathway|nr:fumarylacetoacetate hydrolase family protein [Actinomycetota bacterium]
MRIVRYSREGQVGFGILEGETIAALSPHPFAAFEYTGERFPTGEVRLLAPVLPTKVVAVGRNYAEHAREMGGEVPDDPVIFLKPSTAVIGPGDPIVHPGWVGRVDYEGELAVIVGKLARRLDEADAIQAVLGFSCANDVTARDLQRADGQWARAKGFDSFCPLGPWIETDLDSSDLALRTLVNGEPRQQARTSQLERGVASLMAFVSRVMTLLPGDVLLTGTPAGVGPLEVGDRVEVEIDGIGVLANQVVGEPAA